MSKKICIIGAGSAIFSLNLIKDICVNKNFAGSIVSLMDINEERLESIYGLCTRYTEEMDAGITVLKTTDRREAMQGADFVINVALDHGHDRFKQCIDVAYKNGYRFGGSLHILHDESFCINFHQIRLMESILLDVLDICPNAYYILVANPVQAGVTYLSRKYPKAKIIGMCHGFAHIFKIAETMGLDPQKVTFEVSGVNHFLWLTSFGYEGKDAYPLLDQYIANPEHKLSRKAVDIYQRYGLFPLGDTADPGGGAWGWEYHTDDAIEEKFGDKPYDWYKWYFGYCDESVAEIKRVVEDKSVKVSDAFSSLPSAEPMIPLMEGLAFDTNNIVVVNILNDGGYMKGLPLDYQVEIAARINKNGIHPIHNDGLPKDIMAHLYRDRIAPVEMELAAFENRSREKLVDLVMMDPWTKSRAQAEKLIDDIFALPCNAEMREYYK